MQLRGIMVAGVFAVLSLALLGASCDKKSAAKPSEPPAQAGGPNVPFEKPPARPAEIKPAEAKPAPAPEPVPAPAPVSDKPGDRIQALTEKVPSPCGKPMSLARSIASDPSCKRNPFAKKYVEALIADGLTDAEAKDKYEKRYAAQEPLRFALGDTPHEGRPDSRVVIVEFFDYFCNHCRSAVPEIEELVAQHPSDVVVYFKHFPLRRESPAVARAAVAAQRQGKFKEMHRKLFQNFGTMHTRVDLLRYASEIGLDLKKFNADYDDAATGSKVTADQQEGERANIHGTPALFINGRRFTDPPAAKFIVEWVVEEIAVNR